MQGQWSTTVRPCCDGQFLLFPRFQLVPNRHGVRQSGKRVLKMSHSPGQSRSDLRANICPCNIPGYLAWESNHNLPKCHTLEQWMISIQARKRMSWERSRQRQCLGNIEGWDSPSDTGHRRLFRHVNDVFDDILFLQEWQSPGCGTNMTLRKSSHTQPKSTSPPQTTPTMAHRTPFRCVIVISSSSSLPWSRMN